MSATSTALLMLQDPALHQLLQTIFYPPMLAIFSIISNIKEIFGHDEVFDLIVLLIVYETAATIYPFLDQFTVLEIIEELYLMLAAQVMKVLGCTDTMMFFAVLTVFGVHHAMVGSLESAVWIWLLSVPELVLMVNLEVCSDDLVDSTMMTAQMELTKVGY